MNTPADPAVASAAVADDRLTAVLRGWRKQAGWEAQQLSPSRSSEYVPLLVAALNEVLRVADIWDSTAAQLRAAIDSDPYPTSVTVAERAAIVSTWQCAAEQAREAITRELPDAEAPRE